MAGFSQRVPMSAPPATSKYTGVLSNTTSHSKTNDVLHGLTLNEIHFGRLHNSMATIDERHYSGEHNFGCAVLAVMDLRLHVGGKQYRGPKTKENAGNPLCIVFIDNVPRLSHHQSKR